MTLYQSGHQHSDLVGPMDGSSSHGTGPILGCESVVVAAGVVVIGLAAGVVAFLAAVFG